MEPTFNNSAMENRRRDLEYFIQMQEHRRRPQQGDAEKWDARAAEWDKDYRRMDKTEGRILHSAEFLRSKGLLGPDCDVVDVGCGPGRFVAEFARTARTATGIDISPRMAEYGAAYAKEQGLTNVQYKVFDFAEADIEAEGLANAYDLVFSYMTPAAKGMAGLEKLMAMSRAYCYNGLIVHSENLLANRMFAELFDIKPVSRWDGQWFYALFNVLFLMGYYPEATYYWYKPAEHITPDVDTTLRLAQMLPEEYSTDEAHGQMLKWLQREAGAGGTVTEQLEHCYAGVLWDKRIRSERQPRG